MDETPAGFEVAHPDAGWYDAPVVRADGVRTEIVQTLPGPHEIIGLALSRDRSVRRTSGPSHPRRLDATGRRSEVVRALPILPNPVGDGS
jgi:hypothetical protein